MKRRLQETSPPVAGDQPEAELSAIDAVPYPSTISTVPVLALTLMLAARPTVAVEIHPEQPNGELRSWLVRRLLEEGYGVAANASGAHGVVRVRAAGDGLVVETEGRERRSYAVEAGPVAVQRLEVLHRALEGVEQTCDANDAIESPELGLALRFVGGEQDDDALLEAIVQASQDVGMTLSARPSEGDTLACIERRGTLAQVAIGPALDECGPPLLVLDTGDGSFSAHYDAARRLLDAVQPSFDEYADLDLDALGGPTAADYDAQLPRATVRDDRDSLAPMQGPPRAEMRLGMSAGVASRGRATDPLFQAGWRMGKIGGVGGRLSVSMIPSKGSSVRVLDTRLAIGPDWELRAGKRGHFDLAALVGTDLHRFSVEPGERTAGDVAFAAELPMSYAFTIRGDTRVQLVINPGVSARAWEHLGGLARESTVHWSRRYWRVGVALGITHGWRIE